LELPAERMMASLAVKKVNDRFLLVHVAGLASESVSLFIAVKTTMAGDPLDGGGLEVLLRNG
jgi:hypothetical protein